MIDRVTLGNLISTRLKEAAPALKAGWLASRRRYFLLDDLLSADLADSIHRRFPANGSMMLRDTWRERKYVAAQMDQFDPLLEEIVFGFQEESVRSMVGDIVGMPEMLPDARLYAGGISLMENTHFLNPHLDNSHNNDRTAYRALNLLYYVSPGWSVANGGNLELWPDGLSRPPEVIESRFNRLVVMATDRHSWHSVNKVRVDAKRCCVSNYFFSERPPSGEPHFHVTSFRGRPEEPLRDLVLRADAWGRSALRKLFPAGVHASTHIYKK